jgi:hypothetical protein
VYGSRQFFGSIRPAHRGRSRPGVGAAYVRQALVAFMAEKYAMQVPLSYGGKKYG